MSWFSLVSVSTVMHNSLYLQLSLAYHHGSLSILHGNDHTQLSITAVSIPEVYSDIPKKHTVTPLA